MGLYRATLNMPQARAGQTARFDDYDPGVRRMVIYRHLIAVDDVAIEAQSEIVTVDVAAPTSSAEKIRSALVAARQRDTQAGDSAVETSIQRDAEDNEADDDGDQDS